ncbi:response regulator transcription factor [Pseudomonas asiatica]|uniref:response regulator transcription factor n=1 Tax=Pseudomonas asiatica TaxID=2219225 RepID=UPI0037C98F11
MSTITDLRILVVEDDNPKLSAIKQCLTEELKINSIISAKSLSSAMQILESETFDLCIVDMSIPTYDFDADTTGGEPQSKGGIDILRFLQSEKETTKAIIITQYSEFPDGNGAASTLECLTDQLLKKFKTTLIAVLFYASQKSDWRNKLKLSIHGEFNGC